MFKKLRLQILLTIRDGICIFELFLHFFSKIGNCELLFIIFFEVVAHLLKCSFLVSMLWTPSFFSVCHQGLPDTALEDLYQCENWHHNNNDIKSQQRVVYHQNIQYGPGQMKPIHHCVFYSGLLSYTQNQKC